MRLDSARILALNGGSSSIKFAIFEQHVALSCVLRGSLSGIGEPEGLLMIEGLGIRDISQTVEASNLHVAIDIVGDWLSRSEQLVNLVAIGHRIVNGGPNYKAPALVSPKLRDDLHALAAFDPDHMPEELELIEFFGKRFPSLPQVACFDTAFHHSLPRVASTIAIPRKFEAKGLRRLGFHGISYAYLLDELARLDGESVALGKVVIAHLGAGASLAAVHRGRCVDTTMSLTPASGIPMSTRSGDLDPGLPLRLRLTENMDAKEFNDMVNFRSGLLGVSETTGDMKQLLLSELDDHRAAQAVGLFCYQIKKTIGAYSAALGGLDTLIFSGGIGEHSPVIRSRVCQGLEFLGIELNSDKNHASEPVISGRNCPVQVRVIPTDEEQMIARYVAKAINLNPSASNEVVEKGKSSRPSRPRAGKGELVGAANFDQGALQGGAPHEIEPLRIEPPRIEPPKLEPHGVEPPKLEPHWVELPPDYDDLPPKKDSHFYPRP